MITESKKITSFDCLEGGQIQVRITTEYVKDDNILASSHHRWLLEHSDPKASEILAEYPHYLMLAQAHWND